jgi:Family of unknown function (DUF6062)
MPELPARDLADVSLARIFEERDSVDCPLCRRERELTARFLESILDESVLDVRFRAELDAARGFCRRHVHEMLAANRRLSGSLSSAILFEAMLRVRRRELEAARASRWTRGRSLSDALAPPDCPMCARVSDGVNAAVGSLVRLSAEPAWAEAIARAPFCLEHLVTLMRQPARPRTWDAIEDRQAERLGRLADGLASFIHRSSQDRGDQLTEHDRAAVDEAARVLGGSRPAER